MTRYESMFTRLTAANEGAFVPFVMLGDPSYEESLQIIRVLIDAGADALELGVPFSDPVADGPTIQAAHLRALNAGITPTRALELVAAVRAEFPEIPIGLLIYGNLAFSMGFEEFYAAVVASGADSVLIPDIPIRESAPFRAAAEAHGVDQVFIAPPHASEETLAAVAKHSRGYIYAVSRLGVTGTEREASTVGLRVSRETSVPTLLGFGISTPEHVRAALDAGAAGAITGSAIVNLINSTPDWEPAVRAFVGEMKAATRH
ncbi:tryptophan synthase subunit alpha [Corynebacterium epidermidicanis]|uniref:Tryptophan synthase alpha chain n=1 Tax=Corynebacterium epidermidicanis TaxID=1050174 RepID=A0A0G3GXS2_9CORY|nr:tryptophan synthase, alpha chain [Corynebacterium epidermidicanis]